MGSRGASSRNSRRKVRAIVVTWPDGRRTSFRDYGNDRITDIDDPADQKNVGELSFDDVVRRAREQGLQIETFTAKDLKLRDDQRRRENARKPDYELGVGLDDNRAHRKAARMSRLATRVMKRRG